MIDQTIPVYEVIKITGGELGIYKGYHTQIIIDAPLVDVFFEKCVGLKFKNSDPIYLKFDAATQTVIDGKLYTILIRESFEAMEDNPMTIDDVIVSIKLRLGELDFYIHDTENRLKESMKISVNCYAAGYESGMLEALVKEKETLEKIMRGEYGKEK